MRKFILGLCVFSSVAFAKNDSLLSHGLTLDSQIELVSDIPFVNSGIFYVVDTDSFWGRNSKPREDQSFCSFLAKSQFEGPRVAKAGEVYRITSIQPFQVIGGVGTKIELARHESNNQAIESALATIVCSHAFVETTKTAHKIRTILRYELFFDEFTRLLKDHVVVR